ncbi:WXG100 family type VII secretion target [Nocardioides limicola]|uniref:WXG100 family type VII secretion target n=1 Tax=Nocardioides limicola TaxID=2803368 RepID=UPI00193AFDBA|nr:hypothetical protein [Nocardioides sp. DJM-14]
MSTAQAQTESWMSGLLGDIYALMKPLVNPLVEKWESVIGDADSVHATADQWREMARQMRHVGDLQRDCSAQTSTGWEGHAQDAFSVAVNDLAGQIDEIAEQMTNVGGFLDEASGEVRQAEQLIKDLIWELIQWAIISLAVSAALAIVTLGASAVAGAATAASKAGVTGVKIANLLTKVAAALNRIKASLKAYQAFVKGLGFKKKFLWKALIEKPIVRQVTGLEGNFKRPAWELTKLRLGYEPPGVPGPAAD